MSYLNNLLVIFSKHVHTTSSIFFYHTISTLYKLHFCVRFINQLKYLLVKHIQTCFAFTIWTPDDIVKSENESYFQARPNTIFELGWFYGRLGRPNVCILFKKGTKIHSDLNGINSIEFEKTVQEKVLQIRAELRDAGII